MIVDKPWTQNAADQGKQLWNCYPDQHATAYQTESSEPSISSTDGPQATHTLQSLLPDAPD